MTQEEKDLLLKDLSARMPYGCKVLDYNGDIVLLSPTELDAVKDDMPCKPFLRPMSSMTEKEREDYRKAVDKDFAILEDSLDAPVAYMYADGMLVRDKPLFNEIDWLNAHHFDYRGLIDKGLALEIT